MHLLICLHVFAGSRKIRCLTFVFPGKLFEIKHKFSWISQEQFPQIKTSTSSNIPRGTVCLIFVYLKIIYSCSSVTHHFLQSRSVKTRCLTDLHSKRTTHIIGLHLFCSLSAQIYSECQNIDVHTSTSGHRPTQVTLEILDPASGELCGTVGKCFTWTWLVLASKNHDLRAQVWT